jgi:hypothetical protein
VAEQVEVQWVGVNEARGQWATAAGEVLAEVAGHYLAVVTYTELAEQVQQRTGLRTRTHSRNWIGSVIAQVVARTRAAGLPPLTSLISHRADGGTDLDETTVRSRLACYRHFADDVPDDVIVAADEAEAAERALAEEEARAKAAAPRRRASAARASSTAPARKPVKREEEPPAICPTCFMQLPASGICDNCA